jgi:hypothetical protein
MNSILGEISTLRKGAPLVIDYKNSNRYRLVAIEQNGTKTAYYFSSPIYNSRTRKAVDMKFHAKGGVAYTTGSNANITVGNSVRMENSEGFCVISFSDQISRISETEIVYTNKRLYPTTNGVALRSFCNDGRGCSFSVEVSKPFLEVRANDKYFALMSERFRPFVSFSCIGTSNANTNIIAPAKISYQKITDRKYEVSVIPCSSLVKSVLIEANLYEPKLFQDTTVESKNAKINNAFGSIGFIGSTKEFGEQWLYSRPDFTKMSELNDKKILRAILHLPKLNTGAVELTSSKVAARFCSFGSTWDNKIAEASTFNESQITDHYIDLNLMPVLADKQGRLQRGEGFILKAKKNNTGFSVIATGDNYFAPQILEINYR